MNDPERIPLSPDGSRGMHFRLVLDRDTPLVEIPVEYFLDEFAVNNRSGDTCHVTLHHGSRTVLDFGLLPGWTFRKLFELHGYSTRGEPLVAEFDPPIDGILAAITSGKRR